MKWKLYDVITQIFKVNEVDCKPEKISRIPKQWHKWKDKEIEFRYPIVDDILKNGDPNKHFLNTSFNLLSRFIIKRIPIDDEPMASVAEVRKTRIGSKPKPKNKHPFSTPNEETKPKPQIK